MGAGTIPRDISQPPLPSFSNPPLLSSLHPLLSSHSAHLSLPNGSTLGGVVQRRGESWRNDPAVSPPHLLSFSPAHQSSPSSPVLSLTCLCPTVPPWVVNALRTLAPVPTPPPSPNPIFSLSIPPHPHPPSAHSHRSLPNGSTLGVECIAKPCTSPNAAAVSQSHLLNPTPPPLSPSSHRFLLRSRTCLCPTVPP
jgi:hypothetical protein